MALNHQQVLEQARACKQLCSKAATLLSEIKYRLEQNSDVAIDWAAVSTPAYITEDSDGNLQSLNFTRTAVANAIFSLDQVRAVLENGAATQGDHLGNINQLAEPYFYK